MKPVAVGALVRCVTLAFVAACARDAMPNEPSVPVVPSAPPPPPPPPAPSAVPSYQYGAKFEPPVGRVVHGMGQWHEYNPHYLALLPANEQPAAELIFIEIADTVRPWNPPKIAQALQQMSAQGRIPALDIALRGNQPLPAVLDTMGNKLYAIDHEVANGTKWDGRLDDLVQVLRSFARPVLVRIGGEFNGWWNGYHPYEYPKAFRKIVNLFRAGGVNNAAFVWCYEPAAPADFDSADASGNPKWYPGGDVVDWFSIDLYAKWDVSGPTSSHGVVTPYGKTLKFLDLAVAGQRPVIIAESSPAYYDLGIPAQAQAAWSEWFSPYFELIALRPEIKWFHYVNYDWTQGSYYASQGWKNNDLLVAGGLIPLYLAELAKPKYLHAGEKNLLKDYEKYH